MILVPSKLRALRSILPRLLYMVTDRKLIAVRTSGFSTPPPQAPSPSAVVAGLKVTAGYIGGTGLIVYNPLVQQTTSIIGDRCRCAIQSYLNTTSLLTAVVPLTPS